MERKTTRRLRSSTVILGGMGALAAALTSCGSEPDKRCVDRNSYDAVNGYRVVDSGACKGSSSTTGGKGKKSRGKAGVDGEWYYDSDVSGRWADYGTFDKSKAADRGGFGCSGSNGG
ncbi:hypothetical protein [Streptomyces malaysiensis]|uniref:Lipoprotein n=1 Tax=Streptomyces autolyticus TaxID=75293 RepID=A0ABM6HE78_9ACTN|nr:hypothetical protein [Streptomyces autolyticus]AQA12416.1 hypothetical protein BV401_20080 [Streptomyces autolyticus]